MRSSTLLAIATACLATACATPYGSQGLTGGYSDTQIDETHYRVKFIGNGYASSDRVWAFWMYRCAELTREKGYSHFTLRKPGEPLAQAPASLQPGGLGKSAFSASDARAGLVQTKGGGAPSFIYVPGITITTYTSDAVVGMHRSPLPNSVLLLDAVTVLDALDAYVKSDGKAPLLSRKELIDRAGILVRPQAGYTFGGAL